MVRSNPKGKSIIHKSGLTWGLLAALLLVLAVGCTAETMPASETPRESAPLEALDTSTPTAEALKKVLESELLATPTETASATPILEEVIQLQPTSAKPDAAAMQHISFAKADLGQRSGVEALQIELVAYEEVTWRDGSLGCPQPGMMYTQALVDGYLIQLQADGQTYNYHGANGRDPFLCTNDAGTPQPAPDIPRSGELATPPVQEE